jgi:hypothetical protein
LVICRGQENPGYPPGGLTEAVDDEVGVGEHLATLFQVDGTEHRLIEVEMGSNLIQLDALDRRRLTDRARATSRGVSRKSISSPDNRWARPRGASTTTMAPCRGRADNWSTRP